MPAGAKRTILERKMGLAPSITITFLSLFVFFAVQFQLNTRHV